MYGLNSYTPATGRLLRVKTMFLFILINFIPTLCMAPGWNLVGELNYEYGNEVIGKIWINGRMLDVIKHTTVEYTYREIGPGIINY